jgi:hypothetical protein
MERRRGERNAVQGCAWDFPFRSLRIAGIEGAAEVTREERRPAAMEREEIPEDDAR